MCPPALSGILPGLAAPRVHMKTLAFVQCVLCVVGSSSLAEAQDRLRFSLNAASQSTTTTITEEQTFQQYFEQGSFTFESTRPQDVLYDGGVLVRVWRNLRAGYSVSFFETNGSGQIEASVPHPLQFNRPRTTTSELTGVTRREIGQHVTIGWTVPTTATIDFTVFGGPSIFRTEQMLVTGLTMSLGKEVFPFDELAFPGARTETQRENVTGYNVGVDMTWRFMNHIGIGALFRYAAGRKDFTPTGGVPVEVEVGGLHAGGGVRVAF
jgi:hypothetical protein